MVGGGALQSSTDTCTSRREEPINTLVTGSYLDTLNAMFGFEGVFLEQRMRLLTPDQMK